MGYLLKEALKTLCGVNQWSYAVFWKFGCQNPKLLIWEECYYGPITYSGAPPMPDLVSPEACNSLGFQGGDRVQLLVNKMMLDNYVNVVGEGLVGRAAFTGNSHWILTQNYTKELYPPEVLSEVHQQISAGMQTVAVIPVLPHGVVQLGSSSSIMENMQFMDDVKTLILQLGYVPGSLFSDNFTTKEPSSEIGAIVLENPASTSPSRKCKVANLTSYVTDNYNQQNDSLAPMLGCQTSSLVGQIHDNVQSTGPKFQNHQFSLRNNHPQAQVIPNFKTTIDQKSQLENEITKPEVITLDPKLWQNEKASFYIPGSTDQQPSLGSAAIVPGSRILEQKMLVNAAVENGVLNKSNASLSKWTTPGLNSNQIGSDSSPSPKPSIPHNVLGGLHGLVKRHNLPVLSAESEFQDGSQYSTQLPTLSFASNDLPASISNKKNEFQDITCAQEACINLAKSLPEERALKSYSYNYKPCKEESGKISQTKSFHGSQGSSWVEQGPEMKQSSSSTTFSKRSDEISKSNRKRLKPGENPRPRPKDRQMIQDRVKELREIVPNSAKCSIDALLERTIKHMLFLQSVTKHADKLKQTGESMILNKEGGLLLKDNFEGGATWAYEVGSQSMVCPIIVENLNPPRQMLVEMLCEERGLFLEIADIVRGLGLTILKGMMETRNDKIWARFAVEANRDVTRMEIFLSLVRLLEQSVESKAESANCVGIDGAMSHPPFHSGVSIAATGRPCNFQ
ncbi:Basic helix-loop-helix (BHLH) DNA-bindingsuperfamily protein [Heracleum sosnowskyi]|uniref:Basic helix-loop-helix (BHLH) DNA-bindingsuperfamily protein n=1 Tax=Heracleum sosnowskyi TaxID=360622 RepID=A0AAD8GTW7_9APIA|nr:Basic helix-loop-helix (BHLH) DNA-bindingsuperfamily protein [Heracleum sosnowskyi]